MNTGLTQPTQLYHPEFEKLVELFVARTNNPSKHFFRTQIAFFLGLVAANMRVHVVGWSGTKIPINVYAINLSPSGAGKGYSVGVLENEILGAFRETFLENTYMLSTIQNLSAIASRRAAKNATDDQEELTKLEKEFKNLGSYLLTFDSATVAAIKQLRHQVQLANAGSINFIMDEIGANLVGQNEVLNLFLELYDMGSTKEKLIKSTTENIRTERLTTLTPTNMLLFGEPTSLLNGAATESKFFEMLKMGYARRCIFGYVEQIEKRLDITAEEMLDIMQSNSSNQIIQDLSTRFAALAHFVNLNCSIPIERSESLRLMNYKLQCEKLAATYPDHESIRKAETEHRYFKVLKLAGAYAFFDAAPRIMPEHLEYAITLVEDSGTHFKELINPPKPYIKLAKYLAQCHPKEMTLADLDHDLPYFPTNKAGRDEMFAMASAWGYKNCHVVKKSSVNNIIFYSGQSLKPTDLDQMLLSYSDDMTVNYRNIRTPFDALPGLFAKKEKRHWLNHHVNDGYRNAENIVSGFNMLVFDVDGGATLATAKSVFANYTHILYTTKSHQPGIDERFRIVLPINFELYVTELEYKEIVKGIFQDLPLIKFDESCNHRVKKWETHPASIITVNKGELFDILPFIPNTSKSEDRQRSYVDNPNMDALERWVINTSEEGNRNNTLFKYGMILVDMNKDYDEIVTAIKQLNSKLAVPLDEIELGSTVISSITRKLLKNTKQSS